MKLPVISDYMDHVVPTLPPDIDIYDAIDFLLEKGVTGAPVVDGDGAIIGIVTETDCLKLLAQGRDNQAASGTVGDFMTADPVTAPPNMNIYFAAGLFIGGRFRRLPIVDANKRVVGAITRFDILRAIQKNRSLVSG